MPSETAPSIVPAMLGFFTLTERVMKVEVAVAIMVVLCAACCFAAWQVWRIAESLRPLINAVELVKSIPFLH